MVSADDAGLRRKLEAACKSGQTNLPRLPALRYEMLVLDHNRAIEDLEDEFEQKSVTCLSNELRKALVRHYLTRK